MRDKNGVSILMVRGDRCKGNGLDWDEYEEWLYTTPMPDSDFATVESV